MESYKYRYHQCFLEMLFIHYILEEKKDNFDLFSNTVGIVLKLFSDHVTSLMLNHDNIPDMAYNLAFHCTKVIAAVKLKAPLGACDRNIFNDFYIWNYKYYFIYWITANSLLVEPIKELIHEIKQSVHTVH